MSYQILRCDGHVLNMRTRMPFRFGITTMTATPHLFMSVELGMQGQRACGIAADHLPQKWLTKNPRTTVREDVTEMLRVIRHAVELALALHPATSPFLLWRELYARQSQWAEGHGVPLLLANFGVSLIERAMLDAVCRAGGIRFADAVRRNTLGIEEMPLEMLPREPLGSVIARHTVGLSDPITTGDVPPGEKLDDGLPQSLDECIRYYGLTHFKIKLCGDVAQDAARLRRLAEVIEQNAPTYAFTVDGNENFHALGPFRELWESLARDPALKSFLAKLIFVEQPLHRDVALTDGIRREMLAWPDRPPIIIDESDASLASLPTAIDCGYAGTSHKNCKGIFKGIRNACLIAELRRSRTESRWLLSGEDLSNVGPVSQMQDLALMANLGIEHVERNGHHYFKGLSFLPEDVQQQVLRHHGDLYRRHPRGYATLDIRQGHLDVKSTVDAPFGVGFELDPSRFTPLDRWTFDSIAGAQQ